MKRRDSLLFVLVAAGVGLACAPRSRARPGNAPDPASSPSAAKAGHRPPKAGRLPPEVIQKVVRDAYGRFRRCYEAGLAKDANLEGKLVVRFVIDREGKVGEVTVAKGTTLPDQAAVGCMVREYESLTFPPPDDGIVTVVYPIMFSPE